MFSIQGILKLCLFQLLGVFGKIGIVPIVIMSTAASESQQNLVASIILILDPLPVV